jgi:hypothetical protein
MIPRIVRQGEFLGSIAHQCGFVAADIWNHPENARLTRLRKDPDMLCTGDVLYIPEPRKKWLPVRVGEVNRFVANIPRVTLTLKLVTKAGPLANTECLLSGIPGLTAATTDGTGTLTISAPITVGAVVIDVDKPRFYAVVRVGHMDPPDTEPGVRMRLRNLQYLHDHDVPDEHFACAVAAFQRARGLSDSGTVDDMTRKALVDAHGC